MSQRRRSCGAPAAAALLLLAAVVCTSVGVTTAQDSSSAKGVSITLTAEWQATSYLLEAAEFFADEDADSYWSFIEQWKESEETGCQAGLVHSLPGGGGAVDGPAVSRAGVGGRHACWPVWVCVM
jgi:hypothetical protein